MNREQVENAVLTTLAATLRCEVHPESSRKTLPQWDSLKHIEVIFALEDEFEVQFPEDQLAGLDSVAEIVDRVMAQHAA